MTMESLEWQHNQTSYMDVLRQRPFGWTFDDPPAFESLPFERIDPFFWHKFVSENWKLSYYAGALYIVAIFGLREYMRYKPAKTLEMPLFIWNLSLGIFSIIGFCRTAPEFFYVISQPNGLYNSICVKSGINMPSVYWALLFALSKFIELGDTVFIVLRKRPLIFLQWYLDKNEYHHLVTMWTVWTVAPLVEPITRWYGVLNFGVHSLMYPYFALKTIGVHVPRGIANLITTLQFSQMIIGFTVNMSSLYLLQSGYDCARYPISIRAFNLVYGSFMVLFGRLFYESVIKCNRKKQKSMKCD